MSNNFHKRGHRTRRKGRNQRSKKQNNPVTKSNVTLVKEQQCPITDHTDTKAINFDCKTTPIIKTTSVLNQDVLPEPNYSPIQGKLTRLLARCN